MTKLCKRARLVSHLCAPLLKQTWKATLHSLRLGKFANLRHNFTTLLDKDQKLSEAPPGWLVRDIRQAVNDVQAIMPLHLVRTVREICSVALLMCTVAGDVHNLLERLPVVRKVLPAFFTY